MSRAPRLDTGRFGWRSVIIVVVCGLASLVAGCSAMRIVYAGAPDLSYWWLDRYIDFNSDQAPRVHQALDQWFDWNRRTQLPDYVALLDRAKSEVLADTTAARACEWQVDIAARVRVTFDQIAPAAAELAITLTPQQIDHLQKHFADKDEDFRDKYLKPDPRERAIAALQRTVDNAERLYGHLDEPQRRLIAERLAASPFDADVWFAERQALQADLVNMLRKLRAEGADQQQALTALRDYKDRVVRSPREDYRRYSARLAESNCAFAAAVQNATTPTERRTAADNLAGWAGDLRAIAGMKEAGPS